MKFYPACLSKLSVSIPLYADSVPAGFPSPAADYIDKPINLNELLIAHPASTYFVRVSGESMTGAGIFDGSLLLVDSSIRPKHNDIIIACLGGEFTVKRYVTRPRIMLIAENPEYPAIEFNDGEDLETFGVVKFVINEAR
ncbi:translesion error-prone DNA polymerase V autoproteolytic subunit [Hafnia alvei]|uniref:DNA polymerase V n=1 Tax=Hafnia alvei TaxID=569 RepID=A0A1C6Z4L7_HAFAL|nr:translesion error-prone DNA polymerase V autoproteolytic subunit [Hafnia alvei]NLS55579.1 translesion error-prone DNA polymerase V autoproteolytic subunit [Hafnia alvei]SCM53984.1 DNA polymerase V [Hafnia alvei]